MTAQALQPLIFKSSAEAFRYACEYLDNSLENERAVLAIVLAVKGRKCIVKFANRTDPAIPTGPAAGVLDQVAADGFQTINPAAQPTDRVPSLKRGDLVMYIAAREAVAAGKPGLAGVIVAKVKPVYLVDRQAWQLHPVEH